MEDQKRLQLIGLMTLARELYRQQEHIKDAVTTLGGEKLSDSGYGLADDYVYSHTEQVGPVAAADQYLAALKAHPEYTIEGAKSEAKC